MIKMGLIIVSLLSCYPVSATQNEQSAPLQEQDNFLPIAPYLLANAPTFEMTIAQFREKYNAEHPELPLKVFKVVKISHDTPHLVRAASEIASYLYASTALEKGSGKIKSLQLTYLPAKTKQPEGNTARQHAMDYMAAMMQVFDPTLSVSQAKTKISELLSHGQGSPFYQVTAGAVRYIVVDKNEEGLTFAIEPVKLVLSEAASAASQ